MTKGRKTEEIIKNYLVSCNYKVFPVLTKEGQIKQGDLIVYSPTGKKELIEVKTSNSFNHEPKLSIDIMYFTKDNKSYYKQSTNGYKGWLYTNENTTTLMAYNYETNEIYIINNYQTFKKGVQIAVETHLNTLSYNLQNIRHDYPLEYSYFVTDLCKLRKHNRVNDNLELFNNKNDKCKNTLIASIPLNEEVVFYFGGQLKTVSVNSNLEHKKSPVTAITELSREYV